MFKERLNSLHQYWRYLRYGSLLDIDPLPFKPFRFDEFGNKKSE